MTRAITVTMPTAVRMTAIHQNQMLAATTPAGYRAEGEASDLPRLVGETLSDAVEEAWGEGFAAALVGDDLFDLRLQVEGVVALHAFLEVVEDVLVLFLGQLAIEELLQLLERLSAIFRRWCHQCLVSACADVVGVV